jgi:hypothetical protein
VTSLTLTNITEVPVYSVSIEFASNVAAATTQMQIDLDRDPTAPSLRLGNVQVSSDAVKLHMTEPNGRELVLLGIYQLIPGRPRQVTVVGRAKVRSIGTAKVIAVSDKPKMRWAEQP